MFCTKCGFKNDDDAMFCESCGSPLVAKKNEEEASSNIVDNIEQNNIEELSKEDINNITNSTADNFKESIPENQSEIFSGNNFSDMNNDQNNYVEPSFNNSYDNVNGTNEFDGIRNQMNPNYSNYDNYGNQMNQNYNNYDNNSVDNNSKVKYKFSVKRFIFSMLSIAFIIVACATIMLDYVDMEYKTTGDEEVKINTKFTGIDVLTGKLNKEDEENIIYTYSVADEEYIFDDYNNDYDNDKDVVKKVNEFNKNINLFKYVMIGFIALTGVVALINLLMYTLVRKKVSYVIGFILSILSCAAGGFLIYTLWNTIPANINDIFVASGAYLSNNADINLELMSNIPLGLLIAVIMNALVLVCSLILMTCKRVEK